MNALRKKMIFAVSLAAVSALPALAQEGPVPTSALVRVEVKTNAPVDASTLTLQVNGHDAPIDSLTRVSPRQAEIAILIDDGLRRNFGLQLDDIAKFITSLPPGTKVMIGYLINGGVRSEGGFTTDHEALVKQLRLTIASPGISASPYFGLSEFVKHWPSPERASRFVLLISNGVDPYNGSTSILNQDSPYVQAAQEDALRAGVAVYALYYPDAGMRGGRASFSGQSYLDQIAQATGGESLFNGTIPPVAFEPYLKTFARDISESYVLGFRASANNEKRDTLTRIKVKSNDKSVKVYAPDNVHPGEVAVHE